MKDRRYPVRACLFACALIALASLPASAFGASGYIYHYAGTNGWSGYAGDGGAATSARFVYPVGIAVSPTGSVFVSDWTGQRIRRITTGGTISTYAGNGVPGSGGNGGQATSANLYDPASSAMDSAGNLYIADSTNHRVRKVTPTGVISMFAGTGSSGYSGDGGAATLANMTTPIGVAIDNAGNIIVSDSGNHTVRRITPTGTITTVAGTGSGGYNGNSGTATAVQLSEPRGLAVDRTGNLYIADSNNHRIRRVTPGGALSTFAGNGTSGYSGNGGAATLAAINRPTGVAVDSVGTVFFSEEDTDILRKVTASGTISRAAGTAWNEGSSGDGGSATAAYLYNPRGVAIEPDGDVLVVDSSNYRVRRIERIAAPQAPTLSSTTPASPGTSETVQVKGTAESGFTVRLYTASDCSGPVAATGTSAAFASPGLSATVPSNSTTTFYATATDPYGTVSGCSGTSVTYVEDSIAPNAPAISTSPASPASGRAPSWSFSGEGGATLECKLTNGSGSVLADWATCTSPKSYSLTGQADGTYVFATQARDAAGNVSAETTSSYLLDTTAPAAPSIDTSPASPSTSRSPSWTFSGEAGAAYECRLTRGGDTISDWSTCSGSRGYNLTGESDGIYTFSVRATDAAANMGTAATRTYELDTTLPPAPSITLSPASPGNDRSPEWEWTGEPGASYRCRLQTGGSDVEPWAPCTSAHGFDLTGKSDGAYVFEVHARDAAGNDGPTASNTYSLNTTLPATPTITAAEGSPGRTLGPQWSFNTSQGGVTLECRLDNAGGQVYDWESCSGSHSFDLTSKPQGAYTFSVRADNGVTQGAPATAIYELDTIAPGAPTFPAAPTSPGLDTELEWTLAATGGAVRFECRLVRGAATITTRDPCTTPAGFDIGGQVDGTYTLEARAFDAAGNGSGWSPSTYVLDTAAPPAPTVTAPVTPSSDPTTSWIFSSAGASGFECRVERGALVVTDWAVCASPWDLDLTSESDSTYTVSVRARDAVGNRSGATASTYRLDRSTPALPSIVSTPGPLGKGRSPQWGFQGAAGVTFECRLDRGTTEIENWTACTSTRSYSLTGQDDGVYTFSVRAKNDVDTRSSAVTDAYELDTTAPGAPTVVSEPPALGADRAPTWGFNAENGATVECRLDRGSTTVEGWATCASPRAVDLSGQNDGTYTFSLRARDAAANESATTTRTYDLDTTGPDAPQFTAAARTPGNARLPSWSWDGGSGVTFECSLARPGGAADDWAACTSPAVRDLGGQPDGRYELRVRGVDSVGNRGTPASAPYDLDTQPGALALTGGPAPVSRDGSATFTWSGEAGASFRCRTMRGGDVRTDWAPCSSPHNVDIAGDPDGGYTFAVAATDTAGNASPDATWSFAIDRTPPAVATYDQKPPARSRDQTPSWTFASDAGSRYECRVEQGDTTVFDWRECVSPLKVDLREREDATYSLLVRAIDEAGNVADPVETAYRLDTTPPPAPELTDKPSSAGTDRTPTWAFRGESRADLECRLKEDGKDAPAWRACESPKTYDLEAEPDGAYTFFVRARDLAGNNGEAAADVYRLRAEAKAAAANDGGSGGPGDPSPAPGADPAAPAPAAPGPGDPLPADGPEAPGDDPDAAAGDKEDESGAKAGAAGRGRPGAGPGKGGAAAAGGQGAGGAGSAADGDEGRKRGGGPANVAKETFKKVGKVVAAIAEEPAKTAFPMSLIFIVTGFMGLQGRIDRNDPKLALAPVFADPDLEFRPPGEARAALGDQ